nr:hypothetical protein P5664_04485 [Bacillus subtilis]
MVSLSIDFRGISSFRYSLIPSVFHGSIDRRHVSLSPSSARLDQNKKAYQLRTSIKQLE